ncbi:hypothetical protein PAAG_02956 [Paracoccidioides lutzii Pb01]|uniref:Uncharacterized protein n=1 Tax=Paracoccidioides lutzii (strain ATCC MYA-826 / Pb01) TaxID=502779 RepID=C1GWR1_PARBA|nr:hypothetical protein PAAG_02956 [Paracoccidioides lutzii Pb01]EEH40980.2 hypothetical protein PAAG_02956 [Paracoccidioides lutzii Pb01]
METIMWRSRTAPMPEASQQSCRKRDAKLKLTLFAQHHSLPDLLAWFSNKGTPEQSAPEHDNDLTRTHGIRFHPFNITRFG